MNWSSWRITKETPSYYLYMLYSGNNNNTFASKSYIQLFRGLYRLNSAARITKGNNSKTGYNSKYFIVCYTGFKAFPLCDSRPCVGKLMCNSFKKYFSYKEKDFSVFSLCYFCGKQSDGDNWMFLSKVSYSLLLYGILNVPYIFRVLNSIRQRPPISTAVEMYVTGCKIIKFFSLSKNNLVLLKD